MEIERRGKKEREKGNELGRFFFLHISGDTGLSHHLKINFEHFPLFQMA